MRNFSFRVDIQSLSRELPLLFAGLPKDSLAGVVDACVAGIPPAKPTKIPGTLSFRGDGRIFFEPDIKSVKASSLKSLVGILPAAKRGLVAKKALSLMFQKGIKISEETSSDTARKPSFSLGFSQDIFSLLDEASLQVSSILALRKKVLAEAFSKSSKGARSTTFKSSLVIDGSSFSVSLGGKKSAALLPILLPFLGLGDLQKLDQRLSAAAFSAVKRS